MKDQTRGNSSHYNGYAPGDWGFPFPTYCYYITPITTDILLLKQFLLRAFIFDVYAQTAKRLRPKGLSNWVSCTGRHSILHTTCRANSKARTAAQPLSPDVWPIIHLNVRPRLRMHTAVPPIPHALSRYGSY